MIGLQQGYQSPRATLTEDLGRMGKFEYERFRVQIKLALSRINTLQQKHQNSICGRRKEVGDLLKNGQEERARLLVSSLFCP